MSPLDRLLESYRTAAISERDKGTAFEKLIAAWLVVDPVQSKRFAHAELWSDWARRKELDRTDTGIDLVGTLHDGGFAAIQCKFFDADRRIRKEDLDTFISASAKPAFVERLIVETTDMRWSPNAETMLHGQTIPTAVIGLRALRESQVDWSAFAATGDVRPPDPKNLRQDQVEALEAVRAGLADADRGKLIMACGTGKTLTSLRIAEELSGSGGHVLFLVPSLALMAQTVREWCADALVPLTAFAVCSDTQVGRRRRSRHDVAELEVTDLAFPATTDAASLARVVAASAAGSMRVVFATYQSISVIAAAQASHGLPEFDLIVCDEAHRTTGATFAGEDQSNFVKVHDNEAIRGRKRLYMTATPRIYGENAKSKARDSQAVLASMDNPDLYGEVLFHHGFARAVESGILTDYRVIVLVMDEGQVSAAVQKRLADENTELVLDDATKIVGCWKALSKTGLAEAAVDDPQPMRRALAFCRSIDSSKLVRNEFEQVVAEFQTEIGDDDRDGVFCEVRHVDGTYNARERGQRLDWLKEDAGANVCRILSNARCLTEGVDVPALDAILFLHPRNSQIDVVQAVGRVMRRAPDKRMGYVILPVGIPPGVPAEVALGDNEKYRIVWQILNALRAHDERLDAVINQGGLGQDIGNRIAIADGRAAADSAELQAVTAKVEDLPSRSRARVSGIGQGGGEDSQGTENPQEPLPLVIDDFSRAVMAKIVERCGTRDYWEDWAKDVAQIAERHVTRISSLVQQPGSDAKSFFQDFLLELRDDLNESITEHDAIEMLAQHLITRPVFDALFEGHTFVDRNPVSVAMTEVLSVIDEAQVEREARTLEGFYASVRRRATGINDPLARQNLIVELYDKFFRGAFPRTTQMLGIVYTPVEIVDFIIKSVNEALQEEFGQTLGSEGVHILDPFTGTGTFITRLLQSGLIAPGDLERKYREEIHANEIVLLAYYIAAINIESVFHSVAGRDDYIPYAGICLTDTFSLHEGDDDLSFYMKDNTDRRERQKKTDIRVIVGNPPYSAGQKSENDNAKNVAYGRLDQRIRTTYAEYSEASNLQNLYDSYIRAIRWGSDRLGKAGVMAYVTNAGWLDSNAMDGLRKCIAEEFASLHVFHLRGNAYTSGEQRRRERGNVFGEGTRTPVAITVFVKNPDALEQGRILFHDIGDYLDKKQKLDIVKRLGSVRGIQEAHGWNRIIPDEYGDWLEQRDQSFEAVPMMGVKNEKRGNFLFLH
ncbi:MAG: DEAD/DEAH box helicase, partial [Chloroflexi bacterium]|nr:DEAD/DEAH box helicase [Chloroflexota bacterium]